MYSQLSNNQMIKYIYIYAKLKRNMFLERTVGNKSCDHVTLPAVSSLYD